MADKNLVCKECSTTFVFTENEQNFYKEKGFENEPSRCPDCRAAKKQQQRGSRGGFGNRQREMFETVCSRCGKTTTVPFKPNGEKPVYCQDCYQPSRRF